MKAYDLTTEHMKDPIGIDACRPGLSWKCADGSVQTAYQIGAAASENELINDNLLWDSGEVASDESLNIEYGSGLGTGDRVFWQVRLKDESAEWGEWSEPALFEMGLLHKDDMTAEWIDPEKNYDPDSEPPVSLMRKDFKVEPGFVRARLYVSALGMYEAWINGKRAGDEVLAPGFTDMDRRRQYQTYDVTDLLRSGDNAAGIALADGWARGRLGFSGKRNQFSLQIAAWAQLTVDYTDHRETALITDTTWKTTKDGPWRLSDLRDGEWYDAGMEIVGWAEPGFDDAGWEPVCSAEFEGELDGRVGPPVREIRRIKGKLIPVPDGRLVVDFGENIGGYVELTVSGNKGDEVSLVLGEVLDSDGNFTMKNFFFEGTPEMPIYCLKQEIHYTLAGRESEYYKPSFTFMGFRYALIEKWPGEFTADDITAVVICSDMQKTVEFECSEPLVNKLYENTLRSQEGNFIDLPTDCPQRERMGWTGDAQIFCRTGATNYDTQAFFAKWLKDMSSAQKEDGGIPNTVPFESMPDDPDDHGMPVGSSGWGDAAVIIPYRLYEVYGDKRLLEDCYPMMKKWVDFEARGAAQGAENSDDPDEQYIWNTGFHWGEWLEPGKSQAEAMNEPKDETATAYFAQSARMLSEAADVLGKKEDAQKYKELADNVKQAYIRRFTEGGVINGGDRQCLYVRPLALDLLSEEAKQDAADRLDCVVKKNEYKIGTGFLSTPFLCEVLTKGGHTETAYKMLLNRQVPGWMYPVTRGATTIWETWEGYGPDGEPFASHNHYAFGAVMEWVYRYMAGIDTIKGFPGYKKFMIRPCPGGGITYAKAAIETVRGRIECGWEIVDSGRFILDVTIPSNTSALIYLPSCVNEIENAGGLRFAADNGAVYADAPAGRYHIVCI